MDKIYVVYWSQGGNTQAMAEAVAQGAQEAGREAEAVDVGRADIEVLKKVTAFAMGCPSMGVEVLEESEMEPFVTEVEGFIAGKTVVLFGSYGWGDGQWMRDWTERMDQAGAQVLGGEGIICQDTPGQEALDQCREAGKKLAEVVMQ